MNELKQIRSMAEMILEKVSALEGAKPECKPVPKFRVGDRVVYQSSGEQGTVIDASIGSMGIEYIVWQPDNKFAQPHTSTPVADLVKAPKFNVGDRVVGDFDRTTKIGTITLQYGSGGEWYVVEWDDRTTNSVSIHDKYSDNIRLATKEDREWHSGPPPHIGWWNASTGKHPRLWRWWNGSSWSQYAHSDDDAKWAHGQAMWVTTDTNIQWTDYWPENARVPRIDPTKA